MANLPSYLYTPPSTIVNPPTTTLKQELPFSELAWEDFEKLCLRLASKNSDIDQCRLYGTRGDPQEGIDIFARKPGSTKYDVFQCKRVKRFGPEKIQQAINAFIKGEWKDRTDCFYLCTQENLQSKPRSDACTSHAQKLKQDGISLVLWDCHQLSLSLKDYPELVHDFFGIEWLKRFAGDTVSPCLDSVCSLDQTCFGYTSLFVTDGCSQALVARIRRTATNAAG